MTMKLQRMGTPSIVLLWGGVHSPETQDYSLIHSCRRTALLSHSPESLSIAWVMLCTQAAWIATSSSTESAMLDGAEALCHHGRSTAAVLMPKNAGMIRTLCSTNCILPGLGCPLSWHRLTPFPPLVLLLALCLPATTAALTMSRWQAGESSITQPDISSCRRQGTNYRVEF